MSPNKKKQWGVVIGQPTASHPDPQKHQDNIGKFLTPRTKIFFTKQEAECAAASATNPWWNYHAKKYHPRKP